MTTSPKFCANQCFRSPASRLCSTRCSLCNHPFKTSLCRATHLWVLICRVRVCAYFGHIHMHAPMYMSKCPPMCMSVRQSCCPYASICYSYVWFCRVHVGTIVLSRRACADTCITYMHIYYYHMQVLLNLWSTMCFRHVSPCDTKPGGTRNAGVCVGMSICICLAFANQIKQANDSYQQIPDN